MLLPSSSVLSINLSFFFLRRQIFFSSFWQLTKVHWKKKLLEHQNKSLSSNITLENWQMQSSSKIESERMRAYSSIHIFVLFSKLIPKKKKKEYHFFQKTFTNIFVLDFQNKIWSSSLLHKLFLIPFIKNSISNLGFNFRRLHHNKVYRHELFYRNSQCLAGKQSKNALFNSCWDRFQKELYIFFRPNSLAIFQYTFLAWTHILLHNQLHTFWLYYIN